MFSIESFHNLFYYECKLHTNTHTETTTDLFSLGDGICVTMYTHIYEATPLWIDSPLIHSTDDVSSLFSISESSSRSARVDMDFRWNRDVCVDSDHLVLNDLVQTLHWYETRFVLCFDSVCRLSAAMDVNLREHSRQTRLKTSWVCRMDSSNEGGVFVRFCYTNIIRGMVLCSESNV